MTSMSKKELISAIKPRYLKASKKEKTGILDEFCGNTGYARKYAISILAAGHDHNRIAKIGRKARKKKYDREILLAVIKIWETLDYPCGKRLKPQLPVMYEALIRCREIPFDENILSQLKRISAKTLDRRLKKEKEIRRLSKARGMTKAGSLLKSQIPIRLTDWKEAKIGDAEIDTVAHNGGDPGGLFAYSLDLVDIKSGWSEQWCQLGKGEKSTLENLKNIEKSLPFKLASIDSDSGGEFINWHLLRHCQETNKGFTRSRPDRKNDNAHIEQQNNVRVRRWLGYGRFDTQEQVAMINDLYRYQLRLYNNFFLPVMKIKEKQKINNSLCRRKYDEAKTPYQRLLKSNQIPKEQKAKLTALYLSLNPVQLKREIDLKEARIKALAK